MLETGLIEGVAASARAEDLRALRARVAAMEREAGEGRPGPRTGPFHPALYRSFGNLLLSEILDAFWAAMDQVRDDVGDAQQDPAVTLAHHREIVGAIAAADGPRAASAMRAHFSGIRDRMAPGSVSRRPRRQPDRSALLN
ncbi:FCD domain-containing protein [Streptomyces sp. NPDC051320]|uniref:FadR/GntR family transcriptional regulator n=1 Tax=Streptomyces sp. NPDC051320 TaxID=3154644 RepID=UPI0034369D6A